MNAWALAASILDGTFDEDYPIMTDSNNTTPRGSNKYDPLTVNIDSATGVSTDSVSSGWVDTSDYQVSIDTSQLGNIQITMPDTPTPGIQKDYPRKYKENESIKALQEYISTTYGGHYTSKQNNVQTLDLIESVGDAEAFCRSNAIKYLSRYDKKGQAKRDILKALHYALLLYHFSGQLNETPTRGYETF